MEKITFSDGVTWSLTDIQTRTKVNGTSGNDSLSATAFNANLYGYEGNDSLSGSYGNDTLVGGMGADYLDGGAGNDTYLWSKGDGNDTIYDTSSNLTEVDTLLLKDVASGDVKLTRAQGSADLQMKIVSTGEVLTITNQYYAYYSTVYGYGLEKITFSDGVTWSLADIQANTKVNGTSGSETLTAVTANSNLYGYEGNDSLYGAYGNDILVGGTGSDYLDGSYGSDTYVWAKGDGNDTIYDTSSSLTETDKLSLANVASSDVQLTRVNGSNDLQIKVVPTGEVLTISNQYNNPSYGYGLEQITFSDGVTWTQSDILANTKVNGTSAAETLSGSSFKDNLFGLDGNDTLYGNDGNDTLVGGTGTDYLDGGNGSDTYVWSKGDGNDTIYDTGAIVGETDRLILKGVSQSEVKLLCASGTANLIVSVNQESVVVQNQFNATSSPSHAIQTIAFDDGTMWSYADILSKTQIQGAATNDNLAGTNMSDNIYGFDGNDTIFGNAGNDTIVGGNGNDILNGGSGSDKFVFGPAFGKDVVQDFEAGPNAGDFIQLMKTADIGSFVDLMTHTTQVGADTIITIDANNTITLSSLLKTALVEDNFIFV